MKNAWWLYFLLVSEAMHSDKRKTFKFSHSAQARSPRSMKYAVTLTLALFASWFAWSGHFDKPFIGLIGILSALFCIFLTRRMRIVDEEGAPAQLGIRPFTHYAPWLAKEIVVSNIAVAKIILAPKMELHRNMVEVDANQKSELGKVILANSITLTPGTVSVNLKDDKILVHALSFEGAAEDISGDMSQRVNRLER